jgi:hypothetical protein
MVFLLGFEISRGGTLRVTAAVHRFINYVKKYEERKATNREPRTVNPEPELQAFCINDTITKAERHEKTW